MFEVLNKTDTTDHKIWLQERQKGIGGSDIGTLIGINPYKTKVDLYFDKINPINEENGNAKTKVGNRLEKFVADWFAEQTKLQVRESEQTNITDNEFDFFKANVDRLINDDTVLEIKTTSLRTDEPFDYWLAQLQWYLGILNRQQGVICWVTLPYTFDYDYFNSREWTDNELEVLKTTLKIDWRIIEKDDYYISQLREYAYSFWTENVLKRVPPEPTSAYDLLRLYPIAEPKSTIEATEHFYSAINRLKGIKDTLKQYEKEKEDLELLIKVYMQDKENLTYQNKVICTFKNRNSSRVDTDKLKTDGLYNQYLKETNSRTFLIKV